MFFAVLPKSDDIRPSNRAVTKGNPVTVEIYCATVVFPHPGGPYNNNEFVISIPTFIKLSRFL